MEIKWYFQKKLLSSFAKSLISFIKAFDITFKRASLVKSYIKKALKVFYSYYGLNQTRRKNYVSSLHKQYFCLPDDIMS